MVSTLEVIRASRHMAHIVLWRLHMITPVGRESGKPGDGNSDSNKPTAQ